MKKRSLFSLLIPLALCASGVAAHRDSGGVRVVLAGVELAPSRIRSAIFEPGGSDKLVVDWVTIEVEFGNAQKPPVIGDAVRVDFKSADGPSADSAVFKGEIVGIEPVFNSRGDRRVLIRAFNKLHRLSRGRKSKTYEDKSDQDIVREIAAEAGLALAPTGPEAAEKHSRVTQHNQTNLEFIRTRAARIGYHVWVDDSTLHFERPVDSARITLGCSAGGNAPDAGVRTFHPRLSSSSVVKKVTVRGWNPERKEEIVAEATRPVIALSDSAHKWFGHDVELGPILKLDAEDTLYGAANGALAAVSALDIAAEADVDGHPLLTAGAEVTLTAGGKKFEGKYLVVAVRHRYEHGSKDGWHTFLRLVRSDRGIYVLPEVGDEVFVAFDQGDLRRPYVIGSLWNGVDSPSAGRFCSEG